MKVLLWQIYGENRTYNLELTYSLLSAAQFLKDDPAGIRIVLAADARNARPDLPAEPLGISDRQLCDWQMGGSYNHAVKIHVLHHAIRKFNAPVILIDTDTWLREHPKQMFARLKPGQTLMHAREEPLGQSTAWPEWQAMIASSGSRVGGWPVSAESVMYNSGVLGLHPQEAPLLDEVKAAMRGIRGHSSMFTAEQLAASLVFAQKTRLGTCEDLVEHYWGGPRSWYHYQMGKIFPEVLRHEGIADPGMSVPPLSAAPRAALRNRLAARLLRIRRGAGPGYAAAWTASLEALSCNRSDPARAHVWATMALNMLQWGIGDERVRPSDFIRFTPDEISRLTWMAPDLRARWCAYWLSAKDCNSRSAGQ